MLQLLKTYQSERASFEATGVFPNQAAVLVAITDHPSEPELILTKRASHLSQHGGEVSFVGGKWEQGDVSLIETALRESQEEIGLSPSEVEVLNVEPYALSRNGMKVTPYVGLIPHQTIFTPCPDEIESVFRVPLRYFFADPRYRTDLYVLDGKELWSPAYQFEGYEIWGLTARILIRFLNRALHADIQKESGAPVRIRPRESSSEAIRKPVK